MCFLPGCRFTATAKVEWKINEARNAVQVQSSENAFQTQQLYDVENVLS